MSNGLFSNECLVIIMLRHVMSARDRTESPSRKSTIIECAIVKSNLGHMVPCFSCRTETLKLSRHLDNLTPGYPNFHPGCQNVPGLGYRGTRKSTQVHSGYPSTQVCVPSYLGTQTWVPRARVLSRRPPPPEKESGPGLRIILTPEATMS